MKRLNLDTVTNLAVLMMCLAVSALVIVKLYPAPHVVVTPYKAGQTLDLLSEAQRPAAERTLVMIVRSGCQFCSASMPFYRALLDGRQPNQRGLVVLTTDPVQTGEDYLKKNGITADRILPLPQAARGHIEGTPTLILIDGAGRVIHQWDGRLDEGHERDVEKAWRTE